MQKKWSLLVAAIALSVGLGVAATASHAQYPPRSGGTTVESADTTVSPGETTVLTCSVVGADGSPIANVPCTFTIISEPGTDAAVGSKVVTKQTDAQGIATTDLFAGSTAGVIVVQVDAFGSTSTIQVLVEGGAAPPQSPIDNIQPPATGSGGLLG